MFPVTSVGETENILKTKLKELKLAVYNAKINHDSTYNRDRPLSVMLQ